MPKRPSFASSAITSRGRMPCSNQSPTSGSDLLADELAHGVPDRPLLVVEKRVDREEVEGVESRWGGGGGHGRNLRSRMSNVGAEHAVERLLGQAHRCQQVQPAVALQRSPRRETLIGIPKQA